MERVRIVFLVDDCAGYDVKGLLGQHGLSAYIEVSRGEGTRRILFDFGQDGEVLAHNARLLKISLEELDALILSHSHYDHSGGLPKIVGKLKERAPLIAHPDVLKPAVQIKDGEKRDVGAPYKFEELAVKPILSKKPVEITPGVHFLGEIPRRWPDLASPVKNVYTFERGVKTLHKFMDDSGVAVEVGGEAVVISGCGHSGIVNLVERASEVLGKRVFSVLGGFHLVNAPREKILRVAEILREMGLEEVHAGHCTGLDAECVLRDVFGEAFGKIHSGYEVSYTV